MCESNLTEQTTKIGCSMIEETQTNRNKQAVRPCPTGACTVKHRPLFITRESRLKAGVTNQQLIQCYDSGLLLVLSVSTTCSPASLSRQCVQRKHGCWKQTPHGNKCGNTSINRTLHLMSLIDLLSFKLT